MQSNFLRRARLVLLVTLTSLEGCQRDETQYLQNLSNHSARITLVAPRSVIDANGQLSRCYFEFAPVRMAPSGVMYADDWNDVKPIALDSETCEVRFDLPAGYQAIVQESSPCDDFATQRKHNPQMQPRLTLLRIESDDGVIELRDWEVAKAFSRDRGRDTCRFAYR